MKKGIKMLNNSPIVFVLKGYSMSPCLNPKKVETIIIKKYDFYNVGDVVAIKSGDNYIIHRLISIDKNNEHYITKGDNNLFFDTVVSNSDILGKAEKYISKKSHIICNVIHSKEIARRSQNEVFIFQKSKFLGVLVHNINKVFVLITLFKRYLEDK